MKTSSRIGAAVITVVLSLGAYPSLSSADAFNSIGDIDQAGFRLFSKNLAAATHYKGVAPTESLGVLGLDVGLELSSTQIDRDLFDDASSGDFGAGAVLMPRLHVHKGLPFGLDLGAFVGAVNDSDLTVVGGELRFALVRGDVATPAIALRGSYSRTHGVTDFELSNAAADLSISKGILMLTPYAGVGIVASTATPGERLRAAGTLSEETLTLRKVFVGVNVNLVGLNVTAEADRTGDYTTYSGKLGIRF